MGYGSTFSTLLLTVQIKVQKIVMSNVHPYQLGTCLEETCIYQPWNVIGHCIPGLFLVLWTPKQLELFIAGALISSIIMDSPLWGVIRLGHQLPLWYLDENGKNFVNTCDLTKWISYYYNPIGSYPVWNTPSGYPMRL